MNPRQLITFVIVLAAVWLMNRTSAAARKNRPGQRPSPQPNELESERTRRVREEVQRRIQAKQAAAARPVPAPPPALIDSENEEKPILPGPLIFSAEDQDAAAVLLSQQELQKEIAALDKEEAAVGRMPPSVVVPISPPPARAAIPALVSASDLKRAVIWREILGPPVALR